jgi:hypothetical protein
MKLFFLLSLLTALAALLLAAVAPATVSAQLEPTPILGEPEIVTPLTTAEGGRVPTTERADEAAPAAGAAPSSAATAAAVPDRCEPNDVPTRACALSLDAVSGPFTIVPESDQDFFALSLPQEPSIQTVITVRATDGRDLALSARQGNRLVATGSYSLTLAADVVGPVVLRVENRDPRPAVDEQYRVEVRREIVPPRAEESEAGDGPAPDPLENNWSFQNASPIAVGVVYDLSFACPDPRPNACPGGDHDYLLVPVKSGVRYLVATFDLDPGVDTVIELFWGSTTTSAAANDDYAPGGALSALHWVAPSDGLLAMRVAPRNGGHAQNLAEGKNGYRFAVAPEASELARKLEATIRQQANVPTPTPTVAAAPSSAGAPATGGGGTVSGGGSSPAGGAAAQENIAAGPALIVMETVLRREPRENGEALATLPPESRVAVRGPVSGSWVSVESDRSILPGWVRAADLERISASTATAAPAVEGGTPATSSQQPGAAATPRALPTISATSGAGGAQPPTRHVVVNVLDPALPPAPPSPVERVPFTLLVAVAATDRPPGRSAMIGIATPTPDLQQPIAGVRVQLVNVFGDLLAEGLTDAQGEARLRRDVRPGDALVVRVPAWGVELPLAADQTRLILTIPEAKR